MESKVVRIPVKLIGELREANPVLREIENDAEMVRTALKVYVKNSLKKQGD